MKKLVLPVILGFTFSCSESQFQTTESGIEYKFIVQSETELPNDGDVMELNILYKDSKGTELLNTAKNQNGPIPILCQKDKFIANGGIEEIFGMLSAGDSIEANIPASKVFESFNQPVPDSIDANSNITFIIGVKDVYSRADYTRKIAEKYMAEAQNQLILSSDQIDIDGKVIDEYLNKNKIEANKTSSGIRYVITQQGTGDNAKPGDYVSVNYVGKVMDGRVFDTSIQEIAEANDKYNPARPYEPYTFTLGVGEVIYGWDEGITLLNKGAKATLYIPSALGYGEQGMDEIIVPNSILIFEVELVDVIQQ